MKGRRVGISTFLTSPLQNGSTRSPQRPSFQPSLQVQCHQPRKIDPLWPFPPVPSTPADGEPPLQLLVTSPPHRPLCSLQLVNTPPPRTSKMNQGRRVVQPLVRAAFTVAGLIG